MITLALLFTMSFSVVHEYVFAFYDQNPCSVSEYVDEIQVPSAHGDICDLHFGYHVPYILPALSLTEFNIPKDALFSNTNETYIAYTTSELYKPPTA